MGHPVECAGPPSYMTNDLATILIVDDEKHTRDGLRLSLEDDFDVYVAADAAQAMEVLKNEQVDVMLTDLRLIDRKSVV